MGGHMRPVGQANNVLVFPGIGLGAIVARTREITDRMFLVAARELAETVSAERLGQGALYPSLTDLRSISRRIAIAVARCARDQGLARITSDEEIEAEVDGSVWDPEYASYPA
jgi:malic enzyme